MLKHLSVVFTIVALLISLCACNYEVQPYVSSSSISQEATELSPPTESEAKKLARKEIESYWASKNVDPLSWGFLIEGEKLYYHADDDTWSYNGLIMYNGGKTKSPFTAAIAVDIDKTKNEYDVDLFYFIFDNQVEIEKKNRFDANGLYQRKSSIKEDISSSQPASSSSRVSSIQKPTPSSSEEQQRQSEQATVELPSEYNGKALTKIYDVTQLDASNINVKMAAYAMQETIPNLELGYTIYSPQMRAVGYSIDGVDPQEKVIIYIETPYSLKDSTAIRTYKSVFAFLARAKETEFISYSY